MASIVNRAPFEVVPRSKANSGHAAKFRSRKQAETHKAALEAKGIPSSIKQAEAGCWEAVVRLLDGKGDKQEQRQRFHTKEQAEAWAEAQERIILDARDKELSLTINQTPWHVAVKTWYAVKACGLNERFWDNEEEIEKAKKGLSKEAKGGLEGKIVIGYNLQRVIADFGAETEIGKITSAVVREWRNKMADVEKYTPSTIANFRQIVSGTFRYYISEKDFVGENPCRAIQWPKPDNAIEPPELSNDCIKRGMEAEDEDDLEDGPDDIVESDEESLLKTIEKQSPWLVHVVKFGLETAARRGEIMRLEWKDIDFKEKTLRVIKEKNDHKKKIGEQKGRVIPLWPELEDILIEVQPDPKKRTGRVFDGTPSSCTHSFAEAVKKLGWKDLTFHSLRKIGTGRLAKKLPNCIELAHITGHRDLQTLARRYYGVDLKDLAAKITAKKPIPKTGRGHDATTEPRTFET